MKVSGQDSKTTEGGIETHAERSVLVPPKDSGVSTATRLRKRYRGLSQWLDVFPYLLPTILGFVVFNIGPIIATFVLGLTKWDLLTPPQWVGLGNYQDMFFSKPLFWRVMRNTIEYTLLYVPLSVILPLLLAVIMNQKLRGIGIFRSAFFLPAVVSTVAIGIVWLWLYHEEFGVFNYALRSVGLDKIPWLNSPRWAMPALVLMSVWKVLGYNMVIYLAGLQNIPQDYHDAAKIDGAVGWQRFVHITLPLVSPSTFFVLMISLINSFQVFEQTYILTQGGPAYSTLTLSFYIYKEGFQFMHMGYAAALATIMFIILMIFTFFHLRLQHRWVHYEM